MNIMDSLTEVFRSVFEDNSIVLKPEMTANDVEGWDSLSHVVLILAIENRFKIKFNQKELLTLRNVGDLLHSIESKHPVINKK
jgi:acyl carrier protein